MNIIRAFGRAWHDGLKLKHIGIEGQVININGLLNEREQRVVINGSLSEWTKIEAVAPQGSILGTLLFLVYINDIIDVVSSDIRIFTEDTFIFRIT